MMLLRAKCRTVHPFRAWTKTEQRLMGRSSGEHQMLLVQQGPGEVVDRTNGAQCHGVVLTPQQVGSKHHSQVAVGHLVDFTVGCHLTTQVKGKKN